MRDPSTRLSSELLAIVVVVSVHDQSVTSFGEQGRGLHAHEYGRLRYLDDTPDGDFSNRNTFRDGIPILVMDYRQQVILDTGHGGTFTVMNLNTVVSSETSAVKAPG